VGSWTEGKNGAGGNGGVHVFRVDADGAFSLVHRTDPGINAGYLAIAPGGRALYAVDERKDVDGVPGAGGGVLGFALDPASGRLDLRHRVRSNGAFPAFLAIAPRGEWAIVANHGGYDPVTRLDGGSISSLYDDSTAALFHINGAGGLSAASDTFLLERGTSPGFEDASGIPKLFEASAHAHSANWDRAGARVLVCDKGRDRLYLLLARDGKLRMQYVTEAPVGSSPRHAAFHPRLPLVYVVNELRPTISVFSLMDGTRAPVFVREVALLDLAPKASGPVLPAAIAMHPTLSSLYATTRGTNTLTTLRVTPDASAPARSDVTSTLGSNPRSFAVTPDGLRLLVGNLDTGTLVLFDLDPATGVPGRAREVAKVAKPACVAFVKA
jgi:6-phosphogluconolactonase